MSSIWPGRPRPLWAAALDLFDQSMSMHPTGRHRRRTHPGDCCRAGWRDAARRESPCEQREASASSLH